MTSADTCFQATAFQSVRNWGIDWFDAIWLKRGGKRSVAYR